MDEALENGTLAYIDYVAKVKDTGEVLEATREADAKNLGVFDPTERYSPRLVAVGEGWVLKGLDEALAKASVGEKLTVEVPPEKGFGVRDPSKVKLINEKKFGEKAHDLFVGAEVEVDGKVGTVRYMGSGRVQVDFNHRLAGKTLVYELEVVRTVTEPLEMAKALLGRRLFIPEDKLNLNIEGDIATIVLPEEAFLLEGLQFVKRAVSSDLFKFLKALKAVRFIEEYKSPEAEKPKEASHPAGAEPQEAAPPTEKA